MAALLVSVNSIQFFNYSKGGSEGTGLRGQTVGAITIAPVAQIQVPHPLSLCLQPASPVRSEHCAEDTGSPSTQHCSLHTQQVLKHILPMINEQSPTDKKAFSFS